MLKSYVGIASRNGLERFCPDHPEVTRFLAIQASRLKRQRAVLVWAAVSDTVADEIMDELRFGEKQSALHLLQSSAHECGLVHAR